MIKTKMRNLGTQYQRNKSIEKAKTKSGSGVTKNVKWLHMDALTFLEPYIAPKRSMSNFEDLNNSTSVSPYLVVHNNFSVHNL